MEGRGTGTRLLFQRTKPRPRDQIKSFYAKDIALEFQCDYDNLKFLSVEKFFPKTADKRGTPVASMILFDMESDLANELARILRHDGHFVRTTRSIENTGADIVFAGGDAPDYRDTV